MLSTAGNYQDQQGFSPAFQKYAKTLAEEIIIKYGLVQKTVLEIGCGKGDFLRLLVEMGDNRGIGIDPKSPKPDASIDSPHLQFLEECYAIEHGRLRPDFIYCRHTLEHIAAPLEFVKTIRKSIPVDHFPPILFELPDMTRILDEAAFWDIYYEHCGYYCPQPLVALFEKCGFKVTEIKRAYHGQHLILHSTPAVPTSSSATKIHENETPIKELIIRFSQTIERKATWWNDFLSVAFERNKKVIIWGSGSKAVGFLSLMKMGDRINYIVDINPARHNTFIPKFGKQIVSPQFLSTYEPDIIIIMNPVYENEIKKDINAIGLEPEIHSL
jgi:SAM-dependent methyltransferase